MPATPYLAADWFNRSSPQVAADLIGCNLHRRINSETIQGQIVETEAYEAGDPAMYAYQNKTERNAVVFGPAGFAYIYRIYRQYHCFNIVTDRENLASTILIRAVHLERRPSWVDSKDKVERVAAGPGKLCIALQLDTSLKGISIEPDSGLWISGRSDRVAQQLMDSPQNITQTTRIGLSKGADIPWRWYLTDSPAVSKKNKKR
ncbi:DNA-3-methyladenine glycosylase subfamily [Synechococcus sp. PCC 7335]|uniref:DNA-3-methyladenine glycosylase n=1 Tax=Synechococcus sp. (strain ATCC 29403 / PCC 7335) TaxID=91464 RepID=UPI00017ED94A|nr:DNA-3-methyladenine glycosylase [Synechococcus sp. PCC 7335]EDX87526.1 DNA-3-methyladenine glycosylase subfamily [Synechococcus sp. PCC 7335]